MREIRSRISQRHGIDLSPQQIQDLAARRLEAILDPRTVNPTLFEQLRRSAGIAPDVTPPAAEAGEDDPAAAYDVGGGFAGFLRRLLRPVLAPLLSALQKHDRQSREAAQRAAEIAQRQTEWNALHYQVLQRLVTEVSRASIEVQSYAGRIESLSTRVDYNDRRVRALENAPAPQRGHRAETSPVPAAAATASEASPSGTAVGGPASASIASSDAPRRRRRRRRGRRIPGSGELQGVPGQPPDAQEESVDLEGAEDESSAEQEPVELASAELGSAELGSAELETAELETANEPSTHTTPFQEPEPPVDDAPPEPQMGDSEQSTVAVLPAPEPPPDEPPVTPQSGPSDPGPPER
jgi:hypothetical protein